MVYCKTCDDEVETHQEEPSGYVVCTSCGHILDQAAWSTEPTFTKEGGESTVAGHFVSNNAGSHALGRISGGRMYGLQYDATEKAGSKGRAEIERLVDLLGIRPKDEVCNSSHRLYMLAVQHNFNRGRRTAQIAAAAIYIICRQEGHPFMLLDFSDVLQVNVFVLGSVFLQLCRILRLEEHPIMTKPVDPSLFLHRFADRMGFGKKMHQVANTALRLVSSMKRDWLQTGRRPAGVCGAALYIAAHIHGFPLSRSDVIRVVHVGDSTLEKRVSEFADTTASELTAIEFEEHSKEVEKQEQLRIEAMEPLAALPAPEGPITHGCEHVRHGSAMFAHGMCKECYIQFVEVTGGMSTGGADPPAFKAAQEKYREQLALEDEERQMLPEYAGQGADEMDEHDSDAESMDADSDVEADMASALNDHNLNLLAKAVVHEEELNSEPVPKPKGKKRKDRPAETTQQKPAGSKRSKTSAVQSPPPAEVSDKPPQNASKPEAQSEVSEAGNDRKQPGSSLPSSPQEQEKRVNNDQGSKKIRKEDPANACRDIVAVAEEEPAEEQPDNACEEKQELSDLSDDDVNYFHSEAEVRLKGIVWTAMNQDYIEKQALKAAAVPKQDGLMVQEEVLLLENGSKKRGRPRGSKTKPKPEETFEASETAADGVRKMLDAKKLSSKVNYANLDSLFDSGTPAPAAASDHGFIAPKKPRAPAKQPSTKKRKSDESETEVQPKSKPAAKKAAAKSVPEKKKTEKPAKGPSSATKAKAKPQKGKEPASPVAKPSIPLVSKPKGPKTTLRASALGSLSNDMSLMQRRITKPTAVSE